MDFNQASSNGVTPPSQPKTLTSNFAIACSNTSSVYGQSFAIRGISDAAMYKTVPVSFYSEFTAPNTNTTSTVLLGTATFQTPTTAPLILHDLSTGTHKIYGTWPGELQFAPVTTINKPVTVRVAPGVNLSDYMSVITSPASGTLVAGEGTATFEVIFNTSTFLAGNIRFFDNTTNQLIDTIPIFENAVFLRTNSLPAGDNDITASWTAGTQNGVVYAGTSKTFNYNFKAGTQTTATMHLNVNPSHGVFYEGYATLTATINYPRDLPGNIQFYNGSNTLYDPVPVVNNQASVTISNNLNTGTYTFRAVWDGNQGNHPAYITTNTNTTWTIVDRETLPAMTLTVSPNPTGFKVRTTFVATMNTSTIIDGTINFIVDGSSIGTAPLINNVATFQSSSLLPETTALAYAAYAGSADAPKYYPVTSNFLSFTVANGQVFPNPIILTASNDNYLGLNQWVAGYPVTLRATINTSTQLTGDVLMVENYQPLSSATWVNNVATTNVVYDSTGSHSLYGVWYSQEIGGTLYADTRSNAVAFTLTNAYTFNQNMAVDVVNGAYRGTHNPYVKGETQTITAQINTTSNFSGLVSFYNSGTFVGSSTMVNSIATLPIVLNTSTNYAFTATLASFVDSNGRPFNSIPSAQYTLTVVDAYTLDRPITLQVKSSDVLATSLYFGDTQTITASVSTSSQLTGPVDFFDGGSFIGTGTFNANQTASITRALTNGSHSVYARWHNGSADGGYPYYAVASNTSTSTVINGGNFTTTVKLINDSYSILPIEIYNEFPHSEWAGATDSNAFAYPYTDSHAGAPYIYFAGLPKVPPIVLTTGSQFLFYNKDTNTTSTTVYTITSITTTDILEANTPGWPIGTSRWAYYRFTPDFPAPLTGTSYQNNDVFARFWLQILTSGAAGQPGSIQLITNSTQSGRIVTFNDNTTFIGTATINSVGTATLVNAGFNTTGTHNITAIIPAGFDKNHYYWNTATVTTVTNIISSNPIYGGFSFVWNAANPNTEVYPWYQITQPRAQPAEVRIYYSRFPQVINPLYNISSNPIGRFRFYDKPTGNLIYTTSTWTTFDDSGDIVIIFPPYFFSSGDHTVTAVWDSPTTPRYAPVDVALEMRLTIS